MTKNSKEGKIPAWAKPPSISTWARFEKSVKDGGPKAFVWKKGKRITDKMRLDWMDRNPCAILFSAKVRSRRFSVNIKGGVWKATIRTAINAAIKKSGSKEPKS